MNGVDRYLQRKRVTEALRWMPADAHVLDVGCADGALFRQAHSRVKSGVGLDPDEPTSWPSGPYEFRQGTFPDVLGDDDRFDAVTMLAVVEHVPDDQRAKWFEAVTAVLRPGGRLIITVPAPVVDRILDVGIRLHLLHGMDAESHHGFDPRGIAAELATPQMRMLENSRFEMGLNHLFVFERQP
jgi:2-polyprenyl-3-methyl-5-hydroxy-6-metoxy-1,4-benzoquinol methylase